MSKCTVGLIQVNAGNELAPNIAFIEQQTRAAHAAGAEFVMTPENSTMLGANRADAPAQVGVHAGGRRTYGHSLVISPWGEVLADAGESEPGFITAEIDMAKVDEARRAVPSLQHHRSFEVPKAPGGESRG